MPGLADDGPPKLPTEHGGSPRRPILVARVQVDPILASRSPAKRATGGMSNRS